MHISYYVYIYIYIYKPVKSNVKNDIDYASSVLCRIKSIKNLLSVIIFLDFASQGNLIIAKPKCVPLFGMHSSNVSNQRMPKQIGLYSLQLYN